MAKLWKCSKCNYVMRDDLIDLKYCPKCGQESLEVFDPFKSQKNPLTNEEV